MYAKNAEFGPPKFSFTNLQRKIIKEKMWAKNTEFGPPKFHFTNLQRKIIKGKNVGQK